MNEQIILLGIIGLTLIALMSNRFPPDVVALVSLLAIGISGILPVDQALAGFSRPTVITIIGLFVITAALERSGVVQWLADRLSVVSGSDERRVILVVMVVGAALSLVMNNIAAGAVLLPAVLQIVHRANLQPSRVLMPLGFGTLLGGMATLFTTANLIISSALQARGLPGLHMVDFLPVGLLTVFGGIAYMLTFGRRLLPHRESIVRTALKQPDLLDTYQLASRLWEVRIQPDSPLAGKALHETTIGAQYGTTVVAIWHGREANIAPAPTTLIEPDDILLVLGREERVRELEAKATTIGRNGRYHTLMQNLPVQLTEAVVAPRASVIGETLKHLSFRSKFGLTAVALWREGRSHRTDVGDMPLRAGDALLMVGPQTGIDTLAREEGFILPARPHHNVLVRPHKARWAAAITLTVLAAAMLNLVATAEAMLAGCVALIATGCMTTEEAYRSIEWRVVVLIAGLAPISSALDATGLTTALGDTIYAALGNSGAAVVIGSWYAVAVLMTQLVGGQVTALTLGPLVATTALSMQVNPVALGVAVSMGCSVAFLTPMAHPVNILMMGAGNYRAADFMRVGAGMVVVCALALALGGWLFW